MDVKIKAKRKQVDVPSGVGLFVFAAMIYNCVMCLCMCYLAWAKDWWATLLLIPCCILTPSFKSNVNDEEEDNKDE